MSPFEILPLVFVAGLALGFLYFRFLWLTVRRLPVSPRPVRLLVISFTARLGLVLTGFYLMMDGHGERLFMTLLGFIAAREICKRLWGEKGGLRRLPAAEKSYL